MSPDQLGLARVAFQRGEIVTARKLVARVLLADPVNEQAWLLMARLVNDREQVIDCLEHALSINPTNLATQSVLRSIKRGKLTHAGLDYFLHLNHFCATQKITSRKTRRCH